MERKRVMLSLFVICVVAGLLRAPMITTGLPYLFHQDEYAVNNAAYENVKYQKLCSVFRFYPYYAEYAYTFMDWIAFKTGELGKERKDLEPRDFYLVNRLLSYALSLLAIILAFILADSLAGTGAGLASALFIACSATMVESSCLIKPDSGMIALTFAALIFIVRAARAPSFKNYFLAAFLTLAAVFFKYIAIGLFVPLFIAMALHFRERKKEVCLGAAAALVVFLLSLFPAWQSFPQTFETLKLQFNFYMPQGGKVPLLNFYFISYIFRKGLGLAPAIAASGALIYLTIKKPFENIALISLAWASIFFLFLIKVDFDQYAWMPSAVLLVVTAVCLARLVADKRVFYAITAALVLSNIFALYSQVSEHLTDDPRLLAKYWIEKNIPPAEPLMYSMFGPPFADYDPAINGNPSLVNPFRDTTYVNSGFVPEMLFGQRYFVLSQLRSRIAADFPLDFGAPLVLFKSFHDDRPSVGIFENTKYYRYKYKAAGPVSLGKKDNWHVYSDRDTGATAGDAGKNGVKLFFTDTERKDIYHFFVQHTDLIAVYDWDYAPKKMVFMRIVIDWSPDVRLDVCFSPTDKFDDKGAFFALECKRGYGRPHEFIFPLLLNRVKSIIFLANTPQNKAATESVYSIDIKEAELVTIPPYYP